MTGTVRATHEFGESMRFTKMQGVGNDFVVIDAEELLPDVYHSGTLLSDLAVTLCDRKFGIGADGLLIVSQTEDGTMFRMRMFNPDGSEDMCGNGLRCVSLWALKTGWLGMETEFVVAVKDGLRAVRVLQADTEQRNGRIGVDMGVPHFAPSQIPFSAASETGAVVGWPLTVDGEHLTLTAVNTGSTHTVIFGPPPSEEVFQRVSPLLETHPLFPERTSVLWATPETDTRFAVRIWERGAGETWGCGTGACAVGIAAVLTGLSAPGAPIEVVSKGGTLQITWPGGDSSVDMVGPAQVVFDGKLKKAYLNTN